MQSLTIDFIDDLMHIVADFLMLEPIRYFTGIVIIFFVIEIINRICHIN